MPTENIIQAKADIRREIREQRRQLDPAWISQTSGILQQRVLALPEWAAGRRMCCYLAMPAEVQTNTLFEVWRKEGKLAWAPAWRPETGRYECARIEPETTLIPGRIGILEPANPAWKEWDTAPRGQVDVVIVPGLAFDRQGGRLGHGRGHYDRLLMQAPLMHSVKIGLAFAFQLREALPVTTHDAAMDIVVTENTVFRRQE